MSLSKQYEALLSPVEIGGLALKNRVVMAPMGLDLALLHKSIPNYNAKEHYLLLCNHLNKNYTRTIQNLTIFQKQTKN